MAHFVFEERPGGFSIVPKKPSVPPMALGLAVLLPVFVWTLMGIPEWMGSPSPLPPWLEVTIAALFVPLVLAVAWVPARVQWNRGPWLECDLAEDRLDLPRVPTTVQLEHVLGVDLETERVEFQGGSSGPYHRLAYRLGLRVQVDADEGEHVIPLVSTFERAPALELHRSLRTALEPYRSGDPG